MFFTHEPSNTIKTHKSAKKPRASPRQRQGNQEPRDTPPEKPIQFQLMQQ